MMIVFEMIDLRLMTYFLGMEVQQATGQIILHQTKYAKDLLKRFNISFCILIHAPLIVSCKLCKNDGSTKVDGLLYKSMIGLYLSATRPDIMFAKSLLSRYMQSPLILHFVAVKRVLRYVKGTVDFGLRYLK